eukprot:COSAG05_NODE_8620_length_687_cov_0.865646_1_plen_229_part_11
MWKLLIFDPIKALCCGSLIEPLYACLTCDFSVDALLELMEDMTETYTEQYTGQADDMNEVSAQTAEAARRAAITAANNAHFAAHTMYSNRLLKQAGRAKMNVSAHKLEGDQVYVQKKLLAMKAKSDRRYADKIAAKRLAAGRDAGEFHKKAEAQTHHLIQDSWLVIDKATALPDEMQQMDGELSAQLAQQRESSRARYSERIEAGRKRASSRHFVVTAADGALPGSPMS